MAVASLIFGIIALVTSLGGFLPLIALLGWGGLLFAALGIIFALLNKKKKDKKLANIGLWLSVAAIVIVLVRLIIGWIT